jgi:hypothetical protein
MPPSKQGTSMRNEIEEAASVLVQKPWSGTGRAADMQVFAFGDLRTDEDARGGSAVTSEFALHVQCPWRISKDARIEVGSEDLFIPSDPTEDDESFEPTGSAENLRDRLLDGLLSDVPESSRRVTGVEADEVGGLRVHMAGGYTLGLFPADSLMEGSRAEKWRLLQPSGPMPHLVVLGARIERI